MGICCSDRSNPQNAFQNGWQMCPASICLEAFQEPAEPLGSLGSGARFFKLVPCDDNQVKLGLKTSHWDEEWLGKDSSSGEELQFYDQARRLGDEAPWTIFNFLVEYHGILRNFNCCIPGSNPRRVRPHELLVFRSPLWGLARPRLLNLEVGPYTSTLPLLGSSPASTAALTRKEGIRVEGFLSPPASVAFEDPTYDARGWSWGDVRNRRAKRLPLQRLSLTEALIGFVDLRDAINEERKWIFDTDGSRGPDSFAAQFLGPAEYSELALLMVVKDVAALLRACAEVPLAQKWMASSVGLLCEVGVAPPRTGPIGPEAWVAARVKVRLFGWSRSRVKSVDDKLEDQDVFWNIYQDYLAWILWEASRLYFHTFGAEAWTSVLVEVYDFNVKGEDILIGWARLRLDKAKESRVLPLSLPNAESQVYNKDGQPSQVSISVAYTLCRSPSRLNGVWCVTVEAASRLPSSKGAPSDAFAIVTMEEERATGGSRFAYQRTKVAQRTANPEWKEDFHFPIVRDASGPNSAIQRLREALAVTADTEGSLEGHLPRPAPHGSSVEEVSSRQMVDAQLAFMSQVHASWTSNGSLQRETPDEAKGNPASTYAACESLLTPQGDPIAHPVVFSS